MDLSRAGIGESFRLQTISDVTGDLTVLQPSALGTFPIKRAYYIHSLQKDTSRGAHAHKRLEQLVVAIYGSFTLKLERLGEKTQVTLDSPEVAQYVPPMTWRDITNFSEGAVCLVFASEDYDEGEYVRNYQEFLELSGDLGTRI